MIHLLTDMKLKYFRVEGVSPKSVYIPRDIISDQTKGSYINNVCAYQTNETLSISLNTMQATNKTHITAGLCTQGIKWAELYCTMSHLLAIYRAVYSTTATSKYALIMEDDVYMPINTDYNALAASAPSDFGILQLMTNYGRHIDALWEHYLKYPSNLWIYRDTDSFWSTGIYLINREKLRLIIDSGIVTVNPLHPEITQYRMIATKSLNITTIPYQCSSISQLKKGHNSDPLSSKSCIHVERVIADSYIYNLTPTYVSKIQYGLIPTLHSTHTHLVSSTTATSSSSSSSSGSTINTGNNNYGDILAESKVLAQLEYMRGGNFTKPYTAFSLACTGTG